ncbi:hypothetical protein [Alkalicoccobacillus plakortidis]|uniref:Uncharacterized protein n=1 Tax=Alkalicoccobacillus plakortidis TaxID=444060 RepID=A0ABT0XNV0_9BACI|nr:hypothetical protein [Alkalicoccobacillus plakortidis]MCM2677574.1 hypothetical protein [Alkalicoccobacillus plakortidis]
MSSFTRYIIVSLSTVLFIVLVFMNFIGQWSADPVIQVLFFFIMIISVFNVGVMTSQRFEKS